MQRPSPDPALWGPNVLNTIDHDEHRSAVGLCIVPLEDYYSKLRLEQLLPVHVSGNLTDHCCGAPRGRAAAEQPVRAPFHRPPGCLRRYAGTGDNEITGRVLTLVATVCSVEGRDHSCVV